MSRHCESTNIQLELMLPKQVSLVSRLEQLPPEEKSTPTIINHTRDPTLIPDERGLLLNEEQRNLARSLHRKSRDLVKKCGKTKNKSLAGKKEKL